MITPERISEVRAAIQGKPIDDALISALRGRFNGLHFTYCMDDDVAPGPKPQVEEDTFNLYLVDGRGHCMTLTNHPEAATGLLVAEVCA